MLHIVLTILKIPLILLALALLLLLVCVLLVLFVPVRYEAHMVKEEQLSLCGRVHWLFHLLSVRADYCGEKPKITVKICGYPLVGKKGEPGEAKADRKPETAKASPAKAEQTSSARAVQTKRAEASLEETAQEEAPAETDPEETAPAETAQKKAAVRKPRVSIAEHIRGIRDKIRNVKAKLDSFLNLWYDEHTQMAITHGKSEIFYILKHYLPGRVEGRLLFGLSDPAATGQALGALCVLQVFTGNHLQVEADFERAVLQGDVFLKGHVRVCHLIKSALALLLDPHCRATFGRIRKFPSGS